MKKILFISAMCALCVSCNRNPNPDYNRTANSDYNRTSNSDYNNRTTSTDYNNRNDVNQPSDSNITASVKRMLRNDSTLSSSARMISVSTNNGVVMLSGTVANRDENSKVERMVLGVAGVRSVDNQLSVSNY